MKRLLFIISFIQLSCLGMMAQGWPSQYPGVMLQAFFWDSYDETNWAVLEKQADELSKTFELVWLPQSGNCGGTSMGYDDLYWFTNYNSSFGNEQQLRSLINTFKGKGIKTIADVVINHRRNLSNWVDFPKETYNGVVYEMKSTDICADDDGGRAATEAQKLGLSVSTNNDTGEDWGGMRDLDHKSENVQTIVKAYLKFLLNDLGYAGFRYDMVKGYSPSFTGIYNADSNPEFSVGECWDGTNTIKNWIEGTKVNNVIQSAAFDFQFKYVVRNATERNNWLMMNQQNDGNWPLVSSNFQNGQYRRYAVTFVENHDTQVRNDGTSNGPLRKDTLAANAYMMAMPGTPCVFLPHWISYPTEIKAMVAARKFIGINNESSYKIYGGAANYFSFYTQIDNQDKMLTIVGDITAIDRFVAKNWTKVLSGYHYAYYFPTSMNTAYVDLASSIYEGEQKATLTAVTNTAGAELVYTTNGSDPTASSTHVASGTTITIPIGTTTLKVGLLISGQVSGVTTRTYEVKEKKTTEVVIPSFCTMNANETCAFFESPETWTNNVKCYAWTNGGPLYAGSWPGEDCTYLGEAPNGNRVWKWSYKGALTTQPGMIIFNNSDRPQTSDMKFENGGYYTRDGIFGNVAQGIDSPVFDSQSISIVYDLSGRRVDSQTLKPGLYIINHKKMLIK